MSKGLSKADMFAKLPALRATPANPRTASAGLAGGAILVVLDDDPTGTQTVHDIPVLTSWAVEELRNEFTGPGSCFYLLTNSRSLPVEAASQLNREIASNLQAASGGRPFTVVSRSDSTLRGHFPAETDILSEELGPFDATFLIPYFEAGGRYTIHNIHYVAEGDQLVPCAETPFAKDTVFGYRSSNLREWVAEKTRGRVAPEQVASISLSDLREGGPDIVATRLRALPQGAWCIVNAAAPSDLDGFIAGLQTVEQEGRRYLFRTGAQFVSARLGLEPRKLLEGDELAAPDGIGGLTIVGSYVPKTTAQLNHLLGHTDVAAIELDVPSLMNEQQGQRLIEASVAQAEDLLRQHRDVVIHTSRHLVTGKDAREDLEIGSKVSATLVGWLRRLQTKPRYLIAKGGITSSDLATRGLSVKRAVVAGQILPGVPVWRLSSETKFPGLPYIVFPGNVGGTEALTNAIQKLALAPAPASSRLH